MRLHKFASLDDKFPEDTPITKLPSYKAMSDMALQDGNVKALLAQERMAQAANDLAVSSDWQKNLTYDKAGNLQNTLETIISRTTVNTRMRDFYDIHILLMLYQKDIDPATMTNALLATAKKRGSLGLLDSAEKVLMSVRETAIFADLQVKGKH